MLRHRAQCLQSRRSDCPSSSNARGTVGRRQEGDCRLLIRVDNADETILNEFHSQPGIAASSFANDSARRLIVVLYVEGMTKDSGNYREHIPDAVSFCYVPE